MNYQFEKGLLLKLREGSPEAFEELFHRYGMRLYNFILKLTSGNTYLAEEIVQRTFIKIWETNNLINPEKTFITYLCTIAKNMLINEFEHQTIEFIYKDYILKSNSNANYYTENEVDKNLLEEYINTLIEKLPPARKQIFILSRRKMLSNREIAKQLKIADSTVQNQLLKALNFMKEHLAKYYECIMAPLLIIFLNN